MPAPTTQSPSRAERDDRNGETYASRRESGAGNGVRRKRGMLLVLILALAALPPSFMVRELGVFRPLIGAGLVYGLISGLGFDRKAWFVERDLRPLFIAFGLGAPLAGTPDFVDVLCRLMRDWGSDGRLVGVYGAMYNTIIWTTLYMLFVDSQMLWSLLPIQAVITTFRKRPGAIVEYADALGRTMFYFWVAFFVVPLFIIVLFGVIMRIAGMVS